uniref:Uncharacterized protein n=1 Tax=Angiostrongylus cantonensis TaxID=6313 RepID=A0A0K0CY85_ANGCA
MGSEAPTHVNDRKSKMAFYTLKLDSLQVYCAGHVPTPGPHDPIPHRSNLLFSPKTKGDYPHNLMRPAGPI